MGACWWWEAISPKLFKFEGLKTKLGHYSEFEEVKNHYWLLFKSRDAWGVSLQVLIVSRRDGGHWPSMPHFSSVQTHWKCVCLFCSFLTLPEQTVAAHSTFSNKSICMTFLHQRQFLSLFACMPTAHWRKGKACCLVKMSFCMCDKHFSSSLYTARGFLAGTQACCCCHWEYSPLSATVVQVTREIVCKCDLQLSCPSLCNLGQFVQFYLSNSIMWTAGTATHARLLSYHM